MCKRESLTKLELGRAGEKVALTYLLTQGLTLIEQNWRWKNREIDLIMEGDDGIHIIEVRSLRSPLVQMPYETITEKKRRLIIRAASTYINLKRIDREVVFDIVSIVFEGKHHYIEYIPNAFIPFMNIK